MRRLAEIHADIVANPDDDAPRLEYAEAIKASDRRRTEYIRWSVAHGEFLATGVWPAAFPERDRRTSFALPDEQAELEHAWAKDLVRFCHTPWSYTYHRGFPMGVRVTVETFLAHAERIFQLAPIRVVAITRDAGAAGPFPMAAIAASPWLARLDALELRGVALAIDDIRALAGSPHLDRLLMLRLYELRGARLPAECWDVLADAPATRRLLAIDAVGEIRDYPGESIADSGDPLVAGGVPQPVQPHGRELEGRHGYIPWLHRGHLHDAFTLRARVARGELPLHPAGAPVTDAMYEVPPPAPPKNYY